jgi:hypothetical protein
MRAQDFGFMGSSFTTVKSPNIDAWAKSPSAMLLKDMHSGGTVCSPTRSSVLTGRNSWRDCVHGVYGPGDPTLGPSMNNGALGDHNDTFAPQFTFTVADAIHAADPALGYSDGTFIAGKWQTSTQNLLSLTHCTFKHP